MEQMEGSVAAVGHQYQTTVGQPAPELEDHLTRPVGEPFVRPTQLLTVALRGSQGGQYR